MFWVALAGLIMVWSGEGDDTKAFYALHDAMIASTQEVIGEARADGALKGLREAELQYRKYRTDLAAAGACVERADRNYLATREDYLACKTGADGRWELVFQIVNGLDRDLKGAVSDDEWLQIVETAKRKIEEGE